MNLTGISTSVTDGGTLRAQLWTQTSAAAFGPVVANYQFGKALAVGTMNGDSFDDLAIGVPLADLTGAADAGIVHVVYGSRTGLDTAVRQIWSQNSPGISDTSEAGDKFGKAAY